eukprot:c6891_g1_i2.p1 GENE.c6891_g1_i2~~c6891_g1_i2.p1  ORF type:complete len:286 (-),score=32.51 c6891_g1_i2:153-1010(-)
MGIVTQVTQGQGEMFCLPRSHMNSVLVRRPIYSSVFRASFLPSPVLRSSSSNSQQHNSHSEKNSDNNNNNRSPFLGWRWFFRGVLRSSVVVGASMFLGDVACQKLSYAASLSSDHSTPPITHLLYHQGSTLAHNIFFNHDSFEWDFARSRNMWIVGTFSSGPLGHCWVVLLERLIPGIAFPSLVAKTLANSAYAFTISLPIMFTLVTLFKPGTTFEDVQRKIEKDLLYTFLIGFCYWPFVNMFTFRFIAVESRAIVGSCFGVLWNMFLSYTANTQPPIETVVFDT